MIFTPAMNDGKTVFVFGSNLAGIHGAGAAYEAAQHWGAIKGIGVGRTGMSYAIPTKGFNIVTLPVEQIKPHVDDFIDYAKQRPELRFLVTAIGTGLAGHKHEDIAPLFADVPNNCVMPTEWTGVVR